MFATALQLGDLVFTWDLSFNRENMILRTLLMRNSISSLKKRQQFETFLSCTSVEMVITCQILEYFINTSLALDGNLSKNYAVTHRGLIISMQTRRKGNSFLTRHLLTSLKIKLNLIFRHVSKYFFKKMTCLCLDSLLSDKCFQNSCVSLLGITIVSYLY